MSRLGKMPDWQRTLVIGGMLACSISGCLYLLGHEFQIQRSTFANHNVLAAHGIFAMVATLALGSVLPFHLKAGLKSKKKWFGGFSQLGLLVVLLTTGALLYYGPAEIRDGVVITHWVVGLMFFTIFLLHGLMRLSSLRALTAKLLQPTGVHEQQALHHQPHVQHLDNPTS
jgi:hypothetical protein